MDVGDVFEVPNPAVKKTGNLWNSSHDMLKNRLPIFRLHG